MSTILRQFGPHVRRRKEGGRGLFSNKDDDDRSAVERHADEIDAQEAQGKLPDKAQIVKDLNKALEEDWNDGRREHHEPFSHTSAVVGERARGHQRAGSIGRGADELGGGLLGPPSLHFHETGHETVGLPLVEATMETGTPQSRPDLVKTATGDMSHF